MAAILFAFVTSPARAGDSATGRAGSPIPAPEGMVHVPAGVFEMGREGGHDDEGPVHAVELDAFFIDRTEVTNAEFGAFVEATGYVTQAERDGFAWCYLKGESDFRQVPGAQWRHPQGPESSIDDIMDHPVVCVSWEDAHAYAAWAGKRLPTEAQWEYAARAAGGVHLTGYGANSAGEGETDSSAGTTQATETKTHPASGEAPSVAGEEGIRTVQANFWQGTWPERNHLEDRHFYTAPAGSYAPNALGVHDMIGNVWEWTADYYAPDFYARSPRRNPAGPETGQHRVARGGSWFCSPNYCGAYSTHYRGASPPTNAFNNMGFRCVLPVDSADEATQQTSGGAA